MIQGTQQRRYLAKYINDLAAATNFVVSVCQSVQLPTVGRTPSQSSAATLMMPNEDSFTLQAVEYDADAQGGRGDFTLSLKPVATQIYKSASASINQHGHALRIWTDKQNGGNFEAFCELLLDKELKPGVTARAVIEYHIRTAAEKDLAENRALNQDYGTW